MGPEAATSYSAAETALSSLPIIPGLPGVFRLLFYTIGEGGLGALYDAVNGNLKEESLSAEMKRRIKLGIPVIMDFGYLLIPIVNILRDSKIEVTPKALASIVLAGKPLLDLSQKYS